MYKKKKTEQNKEHVTKITLSNKELSNARLWAANEHCAQNQYNHTYWQIYNTLTATVEVYT